MKQLSFLFLTVIFLSSCEKETYVDYYIDNQSSSIIFCGILQYLCNLASELGWDRFGCLSVLICQPWER